MVALYPVAAFWSANRSEVIATDVLWTVVEVVALAAGLLALGRVIHGTWSRAGLTATVATFGLLDYDRVLGHLRPWAGLALLALAVVTVAVWVRPRRLRSPEVPTVFLNAFCTVLLVMTMVPVVGSFRTHLGSTRPHALVESAPLQDPRDAGAAQPDIWYVVVDRYGRSDTLRRAYGVDNSWFLDGLTDLGFDVASRSYANYATSATSLASTLNLSYLSPAISSSDVDIRVLRSLLEEHRVGGFLRDQGYEYVHVGNWWQLTRSSTNATRVINASRHSEFGQKFLLTTALPRIREVFGVGGVTDPRRLSRAHSLRQLEALDRLAVVPSPAPRLVFAHLAIPHEPYVFDRDGSWVSQDLAMARGVADSYSRQLEYLNGRLHRLVTSVLAADDDAVVILQADEGPYPERWNHPDMDWTEASDQELRLKFAILTAIHLPSELSWDVPEDLSPVNTFRLLFDQVFGTELGALPQRTYLVPDEQSLFDEVEVTGRLH